MWLVITILDSADVMGYLYHHKKFVDSSELEQPGMYEMSLQNT